MSRKNDEFRKNKAFLVYGIITGLSLIVIVWLLCDFASQRKAAKDEQSALISTNNNATTEKLFDADLVPDAVVTISTEIIEDGLRDMGKLVTEEYYFTQVETYEKKEETFVFVSTAKITYSYDGVVTAGVDCDKITVKKDEENKTIVVTIPKAAIQYVDIDLDSFKVYEEKQGLWSKIKLDDVNKSLTEFENAAISKAKEKGILANADTNAENVIDKLVDSLIDSDEYTIKYEHK